MSVPRVVIAGAASGSGKTTVAAGLMAALARRGVRVQGFKAGPDYIDPAYHRLATGRPSRNLDTWFFPPERLRELFARAAAGADVCIVEGVMGLYDGLSGRDEAGSTALLAKILEAPVVLVIGAHGMARSAAALVRGFRDFDPRVRLAGVVFNGTGSKGHADLLREAVEGDAGVPVLGWLPRRPEVTISERHLGLVPPAEATGDAAGWVAAAADLVAAGVDLERLLAVAAAAPAVLPAGAPDGERYGVSGAGRAPDGERAAGRGVGWERDAAGGRETAPVRIGLALDDAFWFYYQDGLDLVEALGAEWVPFSPLRDAALPPDLAGIYLGGGFPEIFAASLAENAAMRRAIAAAAAAGMPVYAECGGLMYLCRAIVDGAGRTHPGVGLVPARAVMTTRLAGLGYREARARRDSVLLAAGETVRGHEFHYARLEWEPSAGPNAYALRRRTGDAETAEGWCEGNLLASFCHLHFCAAPGAARRFIDRCRAYRARRDEGG